MGLAARMMWFDLDDTLFDHSYSAALGIARIRSQYPGCSKYATGELVTLYNQALNEVYPEYLRGEIDFGEMRRRKFHRFFFLAGIPDSDAPAIADFHRIYDEGYGSERRATPGSIEALQRLRDEGIEVAVLTNGMQRIQEAKLRAIGFDWLVPHLLTSEQAGKTKPDPGIFHWALQQTRRSVHDVVMIGDNLQNDVEGALRMGISAIYYSPSASGQTILTPAGTALVLSDWKQIPDLLYKECTSPELLGGLL